MTTELITAFAQDVIAGLSSHPKRIPSKYFYDDAGSRLFQQIMQLPEYYLTDCERDILLTQSASLVQPLPQVPHLVIELGPGDGSKVAPLLRALQESGRLARYVPIDISAGALRALEQNLAAQLPDLPLQPIAADYETGLAGLPHDAPWLVLFLGSSIGNFDRDEAQAFLAGIRQRLHSGDALLLGADLKKDPRVLQAAYDDAQGITRDFNLNLLHRINRELGADFDITQFQHHAWYNPLLGAMESALLSMRAQTVQFSGPGASIAFAAWEPIHTEYSFKYSLAELDSLAASTGFAPVGQQVCGRAWFADVLWQAA